MFHEALLTSEQPAWTAARGVPLRALFGAAAVGACIGWTIAVLPAASDGLYQRVTNLEDVAPNPNGWFYSETPGGARTAPSSARAGRRRAIPFAVKGALKAQSTSIPATAMALTRVRSSNRNPSPSPSLYLHPNPSSLRSRACWTTA